MLKTPVGATVRVRTGRTQHNMDHRRCPTKKKALLADTAKSTKVTDLFKQSAGDDLDKFTLKCENDHSITTVNG